VEQRVSAITLGVEDVGRARRFYEALGWTPGFVSPEVVFFQLGGMVLALFGAADLAADANLPGCSPGPSTGACSIAYNVRSREEADAALAQAAAAGGTILKPAHDTFWGGYSGYFADPDGHLWEVAWNPGWTLSADGSIHLSPPE
jgi:predicted lactoylglutathione lyase